MLQIICEGWFSGKSACLTRRFPKIDRDIIWSELEEAIVFFSSNRSAHQLRITFQLQNQFDKGNATNPPVELSQQAR
jgi:hypothetical protein